MFFNVTTAGQSIDLGKDKNVVFLGTTKLYSQPDDEWVLVVEYETSHPVSDNKELKNESKILWPILDKMLTPMEYQHVVLKASEPHVGTVTMYSSFSIVLEKGADMCWREIHTKELYVSSGCSQK